jgi:F-type H+-transporting ATPase subunit gamma
VAKPRALLKRRKAIQNIAKITKTMQMIATARFQKAFQRAVAARPFTDTLRTLVAEVSAAAPDFTHPLLERRPPRRAVVVAIASNRGLCGGYNAGVARALAGVRAEAEREGTALEIRASGKRLASILKFQRVPVQKVYDQFEDRPRFAEVDAIATEVLRRYAAGDVDRLIVVYTKFLSAARQAPVAETVLPLSLPTAASTAAAAATPTAATDYLFDPDAPTLLAALLPRSVRMHLFQAFLDAAVSEQTARMVAMRSATDNAVDMIRSLTRLYNRSRQSQITTELSEIMGGAAALE